MRKQNLFLIILLFLMGFPLFLPAAISYNVPIHHDLNSLYSEPLFQNETQQDNDFVFTHDFDKTYNFLSKISSQQFPESFTTQNNELFEFTSFVTYNNDTTEINENYARFEKKSVAHHKDVITFWNGWSSHLQKTWEMTTELQTELLNTEYSWYLYLNQPSFTGEEMILNGETHNVLTTFILEHEEQTTFEMYILQENNSLKLYLPEIETKINLEFHSWYKFMLRRCDDSELFLHVYHETREGLSPLRGNNFDLGYSLYSLEEKTPLNSLSIQTTGKGAMGRILSIDGFKETNILTTMDSPSQIHWDRPFVPQDTTYLQLSFELEQNNNDVFSHYFNEHKRFSLIWIKYASFFSSENAYFPLLQKNNRWYSIFENQTIALGDSNSLKLTIYDSQNTLKIFTNSHTKLNFYSKLEPEFQMIFTYLTTDHPLTILTGSMYGNITFRNFRCNMDGSIQKATHHFTYQRYSITSYQNIKITCNNIGSMSRIETISLSRNPVYLINGTNSIQLFVRNRHDVINVTYSLFIYNMDNSIKHQENFTITYNIAFKENPLSSKITEFFYSYTWVLLVLFIGLLVIIYFLPNNDHEIVSDLNSMHPKQRKTFFID